MTDVPSHRTAAAPPRAAVTAVLQPDGSLALDPAALPSVEGEETAILPPADLPSSQEESL